MKLKTVTFATSDEAVKAYDAGRCDAYTTDASALYAERLRIANPDDHIVLPEIISKEPLGPSVRHGDDQWFDIVNWYISRCSMPRSSVSRKANVDAQMKSDNPEINRLLGVEGKYGEAFGLTKDWACGSSSMSAITARSSNAMSAQGSPLKIIARSECAVDQGRPAIRAAVR